jgi:transposase
MAQTLRAEMGASQGTVKRVAMQLGYGVESMRGWVKPARDQPG